MKLKTINAFIATVLLGIVLGLAGCASTPQEEPIPTQRSEQNKSQEGVLAPAPSRSPARESDDMERLD